MFYIKLKLESRAVKKLFYEINKTGSSLFISLKINNKFTVHLSFYELIF